MRLAQFILANLEPILVDWEAFARSITPDATMDPKALRDHAADILRATARDMGTDQSAGERRDKSEGNGFGGAGTARLEGASVDHAVGRVASGFDLSTMVSEYRALRATVIRQWRQSNPRPDDRDLDDLTRFNESIDQSLTTAVRSYTDRVDQSRRMFLAILGHDLRGPLNAMSLLSEMLRRTGGLDAESAATAAQIHESATSMGRLVTDLLDFTTASLGPGMPVDRAPADLATLCQAVVTETQAAHPDRPVRLEARGDLSGRWDGDRLRQALSNLLGNAIQHGAGPVDVTADGRGRDAVTVAVRNGGTPIAPEALATIFDPLVRAGRAHGQRRRHGSIGLGLYIAREVATAHGGTIDVRSDRAEGTVFTVHLPRRG